MAITCPNCTTSYAIPESKLGEKGRVVKCVRCTTVWRALPASALEGDQALKTVVATAQTISGRQIIDDVPSMETPSLHPDDATIRHSDAEDAVTDEDLAAAASAEQAIAKSRSRRTAGKVFSIMALLAAVSVFAGSYYFREKVVAYVPALGSLYKVAGVEVNSAGLKFADIKTFNDEKDGVKLLTVEGKVVNITDKIVKVPGIRFAMRSDGIKEVYSWHVNPTAKDLDPGESYTFTTTVDTLPDNANDLQLKFVQRKKEKFQQQARLQQDF